MLPPANRPQAGKQMMIAISPFEEKYQTVDFIGKGNFSIEVMLVKDKQTEVKPIQLTPLYPSEFACS